MVIYKSNKFVSNGYIQKSQVHIFTKIQHYDIIFVMAKDYDKIIKAVGDYILQGLSEKESALLTGLSEVDLENLKSRSGSLQDYIEKKKIEFKLNHLKTINKKADSKTSQWLLEKICPDQFASRKVAEAPKNIFAVLIKEIQNNNNKDVIKQIETVSGPKADNTAESIKDFLK